MLPIKETGRFAEKVAQLVTVLNEAVVLANEVFSEIGEEIAMTPHQQGKFGDHRLPCVDRTAFSITWSTRTCYLGNTLPFKLFERLARRPNQFFSYSQLFQDVWDGEERSNEAVRSVVKVLKKKLADAGMDGLAAAINGTNPGYYGLTLNHQQ